MSFSALTMVKLSKIVVSYVCNVVSELAMINIDNAKRRTY